jgi:hypothetical protein
VRRNIHITKKEGIKLKWQQKYVEYLRKPLEKGWKKEEKSKKE